MIHNDKLIQVDGDILDLAKHNPIVYMELQRFLRDNATYAEMLRRIVIELTQPTTENKS